MISIKPGTPLYNLEINGVVYTNMVKFGSDYNLQMFHSLFDREAVIVLAKKQRKSLDDAYDDEYFVVYNGFEENEDD